MGVVAERIVADAERSLTPLLARADAYRDAPLGRAYAHRRVADVLAHLHAWHILFDGWLVQHRSGAVPAFPAEGYSWDHLEDLNNALYEAHRARSYEESRALLVTSHLHMLGLLRELDDEVLSAPELLPWLGTEPLSEVAHECLAGHYAWAQSVLDRAGVPAE
ncbi:ClbS/DfsB family four-helix bundle protein [Demequina sp.]|uniref:ClbS/DfsB family four-helix bundle protein n=1 Tax=Demequina sp. TaxID=2050685 RepID=UPI0025E81BBB|nr:ClbS/DfsB family four-helix bundle protein [Demequina sp.]